MTPACLQRISILSFSYCIAREYWKRTGKFSGIPIKADLDEQTTLSIMERLSLGGRHANSAVGSYYLVFYTLFIVVILSCISKVRLAGAYGEVLLIAFCPASIAHSINAAKYDELAKVCAVRSTPTCHYKDKDYLILFLFFLIHRSLLLNMRMSYLNTRI